jgi:hypothetical protein
MNDRDRTEEILRRFFRAEVGGTPDRPAPALVNVQDGVRVERTPRADRAGPGLWFGRLAVAATFVIALALPFANGERVSPSTQLFAAIHEQVGTGEAVGKGLIVANRFMSTVFGGDQ